MEAIRKPAPVLGRVLPDDVYNAELVANVHPPDWVNPGPAPRYNLVVIGAGTAGLVTAAGAAGLGARVALVERHLLGGDCLNVGCVPSKCLIRSSRAAHDIRDAARYGIGSRDGWHADFPAVMQRMRRLRARISHHDSVKRFSALGVDVFLGDARFSGPDAVEVDGKTLRFARAVIATGARAFVPPVDGIEEAGFLTNETVFSLTDLPRRLLVLGAGPLGCELAQAFRRFGSEVTIVDMAPQFLAREDPDAAEILHRAFRADGIDVALSARILRVRRQETGKVVRMIREGVESEWAGDEILIGAGRVPNVGGMGLEVAGVGYDERTGVHVNDFLRTDNPRIYAAGDVCLERKFTHTADAAARIVIRNALFGGRARMSALTIPWCTYTDPEIAHVGMYEREALEAGIPVDTFVRELKEVDRAIADGEEEGFVKVHVRKGTGTILGATIVARHAGEMIHEVSVAIAGKVGLGAIANVIHSYPTQAEAIKQAADAYNRTRLTPLVKKLMGWWLSWAR
ncbi:MAG: mercuric reductase [Deltaproteobacteria bacterium]|nr:mercuric reductase [Candidatus Deferrimicrobiaceae bacterium]